jgi:chitin disaccharide deacetylase
LSRDDHRGTGGAIRLIVRVDDFGMCHAVNEGIRRAFCEGIATMASAMAPCPWFTEAVSIAERTGIPLGAHQTLTCEWDFLRWRPLTDGRSLTGPDATFYRTVEEAAAHVTHEDAVRELLAQVGRFRDAGLALEYLDHHMGSALPSAYAEVSATTGVPFLYSGRIHLDSYNELTPREAGEKKPWLLSLLRGLRPGLHMLVCHPGVGGPELASLTSPGSEPWPWAELWRIADLELLTDPEVRDVIDDAGITLCSLGQALAQGI